MTPHDELFESLYDFFADCTSAGDSDAVDHFLDLDLSLSQVRSIFVLAHAGEALPINVLADRIQLSVAAAGRAVDLLVTAGLVDRHESTIDRRVKLVTVTGSGRDAVAAHLHSKKAAMRSRIAQLSDHEAGQLSRALRPLLKSHHLEQEIPA